MTASTNLSTMDFNQLRGQVSPDFDVRFLLPFLRAMSIIDQNERYRVDSAPTATEAANRLVLQIIPTKDPYRQQQFVQILTDACAIGVAASPAFKNFMSFMSRKYPSFDISQYLAPLVVDQIITMDDKAIIESAGTPADKSAILFIHVLPHKPKETQEAFVVWLRKSFDLTIANQLESSMNEFYQEQSLL